MSNDEYFDLVHPVHLAHDRAGYARHCARTLRTHYPHLQAEAEKVEAYASVCEAEENEARERAARVLSKAGLVLPG